MTELVNEVAQVCMVEVHIFVDVGERESLSATCCTRRWSRNRVRAAKQMTERREEVGEQAAVMFISPQDWCSGGKQRSLTTHSWY